VSDTSSIYRFFISDTSSIFNLPTCQLANFHLSTCHLSLLPPFNLPPFTFAIFQLATFHFCHLSTCHLSLLPPFNLSNPDTSSICHFATLPLCHFVTFCHLSTPNTSVLCVSGCSVFTTVASSYTHVLILRNIFLIVYKYLLVLTTVNFLIFLVSKSESGQESSEE
jgi:hypothetical protein